MFTIGELSRITGLSVKTLRFYHEKGLLEPSFVNEKTGYRYYTGRDVERARVIGQLRELKVNLATIQQILTLEENGDEGSLVEYLTAHRQTIAERLHEYQSIMQALDLIIKNEDENKTDMKTSAETIIEKEIEPLRIGGIRMTGKYNEMGKAFGKLYKKLGRYSHGKPLCLYYDGEYREEDADFEPCVPVKPGTEIDGIDFRELAGGRAVTLLHHGPYEELGRSYERVFGYAREHELEIQLPTREVYIKGPGMIFRGNPKNYLTEIQLLVRQNVER